jgi:hypothetical protein
VEAHGAGEAAVNPDVSDTAQFLADGKLLHSSSGKDLVYRSHAGLGALWKKRVCNYLQSCARALSRMSNVPPACACANKAPEAPITVVRCADCPPQDEFLCIGCAGDIHESFVHEDHHLTHLCPFCGQFGSLFICPACSDAGVIRCATCLEKAHKRLTHDYDYDALLPVDQKLLCGPAESGELPHGTAPSPFCRFSPVPAYVEAGPSRLSPQPSPMAALAASTTLDPKFVHMLRARAIVENIGQHVVIECFRQRWITYTGVCRGCGVSHGFDLFRTACLKWVTKSQHARANDSARKCVYALNDGLIASEGVAGSLHKFFDLGALCNFVRYVDQAYFPQNAIRDEAELKGLTRVRGEVFHKQVMSDTECNAVRDEVKQRCIDLLKNYPSASWDEVKIEARLVDIAMTGGDLMKEFREQILRECRRDTALQASALMATCTHQSQVEHSRQIANVLLNSSYRRILIIPPLTEGEQQREFYRTRLQYLLDVPWMAVLDFNQLYSAAVDRPAVVDQAAFGPMEITTELSGDLNSYGVRRSLYTQLPAQVAFLRNHFAHIVCYIVVAAIDGIDVSSSALQKLSGALSVITSAQFTNERNWKVMPVVSSAILIGSPGLQQVLLPIVSSGDTGSDSQPLNELMLCEKCSSDASFIEAFVAGRVNSERYVEFYAATDFYNKVGMPRTDLMPFLGTMDFLSYNAERTPSYVTPEEITDFEREFGVDKAADEVRRVEFKRFLGDKGKDASWLLFSKCDHSKVVERDAVQEIVDLVRGRQYQTIFLPYMIGCGATTIARNVLYEVREKFVCIVLKKRLQTDAMEKAKKLFQHLDRKTGLPLLVLLDYGLSLQALDAVRAQLIRSNVYFLCPYREAPRATEQGKKDNPPQKSQYTLRLSSILSEREKRLFSALLPAGGPSRVLPDGTPLSPFLTPQGNFKAHVQGIQGWHAVRDRLLQLTNEQMVNIGLEPINIVLLRNYQRDKQRYGRSQVFETRQDSSLPPVLYGLFGFDEAYAEHAGAFLLDVLEGLQHFELEIVQLCCFLALFAPPVNLPIKVALFLESGHQQWATRTVSWSDNLLALVEVLDAAQAPPVELAIRALPVAYKLAESTRVFGPRRQWAQSVAAYITDILFPLLKDSSGKELVGVLEPALRQAFVGFKIWHPAKTIDPTKVEKALSYSFLVRLLLFGNKTSIEHAKGFMRTLTLLVDDPEKLYATHCARLLTGQGEREKNFSEILEAEAILLRNNSPHLPVVCDRLGHVYKAHLRVLLNLFEAKPACARLTVGGDEASEEGVGFLQKRSLTHAKYYHSTATQPALISFSAICSIALEADRYFGWAMQRSGGAYPNPMVGATQTWEAVLNIVRCALCDGRHDLFRSYISGNAQHPKLPEVFKRLKELCLLEYCSDYLHAARKASRYKTTGDANQSNQESLFASHTNERTQEKISVLKRNIAKHFYTETLVRDYTRFSIEMAKYWMVWADRYSELSCDKLCYSLLAFADALQPLLGTKGQLAQVTAGTADQRAGVCLELFFSAGCSLTSDRYSSREVTDSLNYFMNKLRPDLRDKLDFRSAKPTIERWIDISQRGGSFGLGARLGMVALLLRRVVLEEEQDAFAQLKTHVRGLEEDSSDYHYTNKPRLFLAIGGKSPLVVYSCFYTAEDLPFGSEMNGMTFREREGIYASETAREYLRELSGIIATKSGKKGESFVIKCSALQLNDVFCFADDCTFELEVGMRVTFVLAIRDGGLVALGLCKTG